MSYTDWPWDRIPNKTGLTYTTLANPKLCLHTTETRGLPNYDWPPHITYDIDNDRGWQHVPADKGAYALRSPGGGRSPNYQAGPVFQIEVISYAKDSPNKPDWWYDRLSALIVDVCTTQNIPRAVYPTGFIGSQAYGEDGANRITWDQYRLFSGILGHQHVPHNTHWDPGDLDETRLELGNMATYRTVKNVPEKDGQPKEWAKAVIDWGIDSGLIVIDDKNPEDWASPMTDGQYWTFEYRQRDQGAGVTPVQVDQKINQHATDPDAHHE